MDFLFRRRSFGFFKKRGNIPKKHIPKKSEKKGSFRPAGLPGSFPGFSGQKKVPAKL
jgi:hypothetical protein